MPRLCAVASDQLSVVEWDLSALRRLGVLAVFRHGAV
jgi:hypothetical protein